MAQNFLGGILGGVQAPANALAGQPVTYGNVLNTAGMAQFGGGSMARPAPAAFASKAEKMYDLPTKSVPGEAYDGSLGGLYSRGLDSEGRPLVARHVVGRTEDRVGEQSLSAQALAETSQRLAGSDVEAVQKSRLPTGSIGAVSIDRRSGRPYDPRVWSGLDPANYDRASRHEVGHIIDTIAGAIPADGLVRDELSGLYDRGLNRGWRPGRKPETTPKSDGYTAEQAPREYMAEALRHYMTAPDTFKALAPKTAARIREYVNAHPEISPIIQFNANAAPLLGGAVLSAGGQNALGGQTMPQGQTNFLGMR